MLGLKLNHVSKRGHMKLPPADGVCLSITRCNGGVWRTGYSILLNVSMNTQLLPPIEVLEKATCLDLLRRQHKARSNKYYGFRCADSFCLYLSVFLPNIYSHICIYRFIELTLYWVALEYMVAHIFLWLPISVTMGLCSVPLLIQKHHSLKQIAVSMSLSTKTSKWSDRVVLW